MQKNVVGTRFPYRMVSDFFFFLWLLFGVFPEFLDSVAVSLFLISCSQRAAPVSLNVPCASCNNRFLHSQLFCAVMWVDWGVQNWREK